MVRPGNRGRGWDYERMGSQRQTEEGERMERCPDGGTKRPLEEEERRGRGRKEGHTEGRLRQVEEAGPEDRATGA